MEEQRPRCVLAAAQLQGVSEVELDASLAELKRLCDTLGMTVVGRVVQRRAHLDQQTVFGEGKLAELADWTGGTGVVPSAVVRKIQKKDLRGGGLPELPDDDDDLIGLDPDAPPPGPKEKRADVIVFDHELSPSVLRNLEKACEAEVLDRTGVIVEIFHRHAKSREARLQVEIARLTYLAPRIRETGGQSERQAGRGAGESSVELDRRKIRDRIAELKKELEEVAGQQVTRRSRRSDVPRVALVGYTNAGKSSLLRALTASEIYVADKLFATLDTTVRALAPETNPRVLVSDTVGFIKKLPHDLVASFRSTLDEALEAHLLLYVVDASDVTFRAQLEVTRGVLAEIGADEGPSWLVLNKIDCVDEAGREALIAEYPDAILLSAKDPADVATMHARLIAHFRSGLEEAELFVPWSVQGVVGEIRTRTAVLEEAYEDDGVRYRVRATSSALARIRARLAEG
jgi:GTP-binding protein HflX